MGAQLHLFRRGNVFYWRRRVPEFSTEKGMIQLSLRTGMRREAYILARKLTAESDRMYEDMSRDRVSIPDARAFLSHVINDELARMAHTCRGTRPTAQTGYNRKCCDDRLNPPNTVRTTIRRSCENTA